MATNNTITFAKAIKEDMEAYGQEVNFNRAIVDISGLKRVQLRILYTMYKMKLFPNKPRAKCPDIVGNVIQLHPHADTAIYDALVRMAQPWTLNYPLIDFKGNAGTEDGDPAAASRYTEARLSEYGMALIANIESTSPFVPDYADHGMEPEFLVPAFPSLFVNISKGIGVAAACNFLPHSIESIEKVISERMNGTPDTEILADLFPVFPTGGILMNGADLVGIYQTGRGSVRLRAKHKVVNNKIIFTELPYQVSRTSVIEMLQDRKDSRILSVYDTSDMKQKSITVEVRAGVNKDEFIEELFKTTRLEDTFSVNMTVHDRKKVELQPFLPLIDEYIAQQHTRIVSIAVATREAAERKKHELEGFVIVLPDIDRVIEIIKTSANRGEASATLQSEFGITDIQASAILSLKLSQLTKRGVEEIQEEILELTTTIQTQYELETVKDARDTKILEEVAAMPRGRKYTMEVQMGSMPQSSGATDKTIIASNGDELTLGDNDEVVVVTAERRGYRVKGKQLDKMPKDEIVLLHTPEWVNSQASLDLFGMKIHPSIITVQCKSTRGANLKL